MSEFGRRCSIFTSFGHESPRELNVLNFVLPFVCILHELYIVDFETSHLGNSHEVLDVYNTCSLLINYHAKFNELLNLVFGGICIHAHSSCRLDRLKTALGDHSGVLQETVS